MYLFQAGLRHGARAGQEQPPGGAGQLESPERVQTRLGRVAPAQQRPQGGGPESGEDRERTRPGVDMGKYGIGTPPNKNKELYYSHFFVMGG